MAATSLLSESAVDIDQPLTLRREPSISSVQSGASLTRRSRTRRASRSRTRQGSSRQLFAQTPLEELPVLDKPLVEEPPEIMMLSSSSSAMPSPARPPRSPQRARASLDIERRDGNMGAKSLTVDDARLRTSHSVPPSPLSGSFHTADQPSPQPSLRSQRTTPLAFSRIPSLPQLNPQAANIRDSMLTQDSGFSATSSSLYPPSTSDAEFRPEPSIVGQDNQNLPHLEDLQDYDGDDVSYRLRLLVNNNYYLPPAHAKPSPQSFVPSVPSTPKKSSPITDFFKLGTKAKSKPTTPPASSGPTYEGISAPMLRTTSDSSTMHGLLPHSEPRSHPPVQGASPSLPISAPQEQRSGRVVVVRERVPDLATAARIAELEMKTRNPRPEADSNQADVNVIDPTDAVDLPPPSASSPFAVQASALRGLDVEHSVGAAILADRLPPKRAGAFSSDTDDEWRRALLKAAVDHSLNASMSSRVASPKSPISHETSQDTMRRLDQRIVTPPLMENTPRPKPITRIASRMKTSTGHEDPPIRINTPDAPLASLPPPPRKHLINPLYSLSQSDLDEAGREEPSGDKGPRASTSSPRLSDSYETNVRPMPPLTPPPLGRNTTHSFDTSRERAETSASAYSVEDEDDRHTRPSISLTRSVTGSSQASPTASAFQDILNGNPRDTISTYGRASASSRDRLPASTGASYDAVPAPPRGSSLGAVLSLSSSQRSYSLQASVPASGSGTHQSDGSIPASIDPILAPEPTTPPFPISERRGNPSGVPLTLDVPTGNFMQEIHSAPPPSSPTSFFDSIASQPNAMDDLDSSDESDSDNEGYHTSAGGGGSSSIYGTPLPRDSRSTLMRLGNYSSPHVASQPRRSEDPTPPPMPARAVDSSLAVEFTPERNRTPKKPWTRRLWSDHGHGSPPSAASFVQYSRHASEDAGGSDREFLPSAVQRRPATSEGQKIGVQGPSQSVRRKREEMQQQRTHESVMRLDGMMRQHMEAEKDRMRQIAVSMRSGKST